MESPFEVLGIEPDADDGEIVDAYRERVKEAHPDQGGSAAEFQAVKTAYERLQNGYEPGDPLPDEAPEPEPESPPEPDDPMVEFLNFEVLEDHGWALEDEDLFEKAADAGLRSADFGRFYVDPNDTLLEAAEKNGFAWPFACRGGACTNCAVAVVEGEMPSPASHILPPELTEKGIRLSCIAAPVS
ncbi:MAG: 2Fe-2S iron-sulfur cluster-binding protein, partial [Haloarcula sp.]